MAGEGQDEAARSAVAGLSKVRSTDYFRQVVPGPDWVGSVLLDRVVGETIAPEAPHLKEWAEAMLTGSCGGKEIYPHVWDGGSWWDKTAIVQWRDGSVTYQRAGDGGKFDLLKTGREGLGKAFCERALLLYDLESTFDQVNMALDRAVISLRTAVAEDALKRAVIFLRHDMKMKMLKMIEKSSASYKESGLLVEHGTGYCGVPCCKNWKRHDMSERWMLQLMCRAEDPDDLFLDQEQQDGSRIRFQRVTTISPCTPIPDTASPSEQELWDGPDSLKRVPPAVAEEEDVATTAVAEEEEEEAESSVEEEEAGSQFEQAESQFEQEETLKAPPRKKQKTTNNHVETV